MTGKQSVQPGDVVATRAQDHGDVGDLQDVVVVLRADRAPPSQSAATDLSNVIPFARSRRTGAEPAPPPVIIGPDDRPAAPPPSTGVVRQVALLVCSLAIHSALVFTFWEEPRPLASIGMDAISVEIVGDNVRPGPKQGAPADEVKSDQVKEDDQPVEQEQQRTAEVSEVTPQEKQAETVAEQPAEKAEEQQPDTRQAIAMQETPQAETPTALPRETPPDMRAVIAPPRDVPKEVMPVEPKAKQPEQKKAEQKKAEQKKIEKKKSVRPTEAAGGAGMNSVASDPNYRGRVSAHLQRHKRYPPGANGATGSGVVTFSINGSGTVTSVSVSRSAGAAVLDQEMMAMVRRASPVPAPPGGRAMSFTVPVGFTLPR